uniref:Putative glycoprotein p2 n=1 Tax=Emaravirus rosae TaxID=1980433 RepID=A0A6G6C502_9VIRU|nr:putative glycoprotein p2 [Emaravirus rosae]
MKMSLRNTLVAIGVLLLSCGTFVKEVKNHFHAEVDVCTCTPNIEKLAKEFVVCFPGCQIKPVNSHLFNETCSYMEQVTVTICNGDRYISTKPSIIAHKSYVWETYLNKAWKVIVSLFVWLMLVISKTPVLCIIALLNKALHKIFPKRLWKCSRCDSEYLFSHLDCPTPSFKNKTDYNFLFYILLVLSVVTTIAKADDNQYNYYLHSNVTEIQVLDKEHYQQDFDVNGYLYTITILNSHLVMEVINISDIYIPVSHKIEEVTYSCDGAVECLADLKKKTTNDNTWYLKKVHDGFSCLTTTATVCGACTSRLHYIGTKATTAKVSPYIDIQIKYGNKTEVIEIREFSKYIHLPYYVKPLAPILVESNEMLISDHKVFYGQFCDQPSYGCFGPNYKKDGQMYVLNSPMVKDPMTHDREVILVHCTDPGNTDMNSLKSTDFVYQNQTIIRPFEFGMISMGIPNIGKLIGDFCEKPADVISVNVNGCYDCQLGIEIVVKFNINTKCAQIKCDVGKVSYEYFVDSSSNTLTLHSFYDREEVFIKCNKYSGTFRLEHSKDTDYYKTSNEVHGSATYDFNLLKHIPNLLTNFKTLILSIILVIMVVYMLISISKHTIKHFLLLKKKRKLSYNKKNDISEEEVIESIMIGDPDI